MKGWLVVYSTPMHDSHTIVVRCEKRSDVRAIVKKHLGSADFTINRITERSVMSDEDFYKSLSSGHRTDN